ncbi:Putative membrane-bound redox modulator Alx [Buchnera aphidicola (Phyllaphis fagi)]|uniref:TerC family protein n=1 Tax=Buchnera aphidicola TaxID=9 RepID=UPI003463C8BD
MDSTNSIILYLGFFSIIIVSIYINIFLKKKYLFKYSLLQQSYCFFIFWFLVTCCFSLFFWIYCKFYISTTVANSNFISFWLGYCVEQSFSIDNIFVWFLLFRYFDIPIQLQKTVLSFGILGAFILRGSLILIGYCFFSHWGWIIFLFSIILLFTGIEMFFLNANDNQGIKKNIILRYITIFLRITPQLEGEKFFVYRENLLYVTPLLITLIMIELSDIVFSIDSIPAIFSIIQDPFIIITSNFFSILGLRSIYFIIIHIINKFYYIQSLISLMMILISIKMIVNNFLYIWGSFFAIFFSIILLLFLIYNFIVKYNLFR